MSKNDNTNPPTNTNKNDGTNSSENSKTQKKPKKAGLIRTEAVIPFAIVVLVFGIYFKFFFDSNLKFIFEWAGYQTIGAQVDIQNLETSFFNGTFRIQGLAITQPERPTHNMIEIGDIRFGLVWDGLLRAKIVIEEMAVEQIQIGTKRSTPGKVMPPPPPKEKSDNSPSALEKESEKVQSMAQDAVNKKTQGNVLGDVSAMLSGTSAEDQLGNIESSLQSKKKLAEVQKDLKEKQIAWEAKIKTLPQSKEIEELGQRLSKVKTSNFSNPQELINSLKEIDQILKDADSKYKQVDSLSKELTADINNLQKSYKEVESLVNKDISDLQGRFRIPKIDAQSIVLSVLDQYMAPYKNMIFRYLSIAEKYVPPNLMKKLPGKDGGSSKNDSGDTDTPNIEIQPRPRARGISYEFGRQNSYPLFWIKKIVVTSKASSSLNTGDMKGLVTDIASNQLLTGKPTVATFKGDFPSIPVQGISSEIEVDNRNKESKITFQLDVQSYGIDGKDLVQSDDAKISFKKAIGSIKSQAELVGLKNLKFNLNNNITKIDYDITAKNETLQEILNSTFNGMPVVTINGSVNGALPSLDLQIQSNIGEELEKGFNKHINKKIEEQKAKLNLAIEQSIGKQKAEIEAEINKFKNQYEQEAKKIQDQINKEKISAEKKTAQSKKEGENQGQKKIEQEGQKALDEMKKKLGL